MNNKKIAPIVIGILLGAYYLLVFVMCAYLAMVDSIFALILVVIPTLLLGLIIYVVKQRLKEIDGGEEDDLSKYWLYYGERVWNVRLS